MPSTKNLESLLHEIESIDFNKTEKYLLTYPVFVEHFKAKQVFTKTDILQGIAFVYSWMPRVISIDETHTEPFAEAVNKFKVTNTGDDQLIDLATGCCGGSLVGASKLLHFIFPSIFPIYDSHVYKYFFNKEKAHHYNVKMKDNYIMYRNECLELAKTKEANKLNKFIAAKLDYYITNLRAIEMAIFYASKLKSEKEKKLANNTF